MKPLLVLIGMLTLAVPAGLAAQAAAAAAPAAQRGQTGSVEVTLDQSRITTAVGTRLTVQSRIVNSGSAPTDRLVAHLNVASLDGVYVDLEDWSADVTREVAALPNGGSTSVSWEFQAVNAGTFNVYVAVMPNGPSSAGTGPLAVSPPVHITVAGRRTLTAGGALPVAIVVPVLLGLFAAGTRYRVRRSG